MTNASTIHTFECRGCHGQFASYSPDSDLCGYCQARHDQAVRQAAGFCGFGCEAFGNVCPNKTEPNGSGFCADHQSAVRQLDADEVDYWR